MPNLQIKGIDESLYKQIKDLAASENRSVSQQILFLTKQYLAGQHLSPLGKTAGEALLDLSGSWDDERSTQEIVESLRSQRHTYHRFSGDI